MSDVLLVEIIKAVGFIVAAGVPSVAVLVINKSRQKNESLKRDLTKALEDLQFLLAVEAEHGRMWREASDKSNLLLVRKIVHARDGVDWSGDFHQKRIVKKLESLK